MQGWSVRGNTPCQSPPQSRSGATSAGVSRVVEGPVGRSTVGESTLRCRWATPVPHVIAVGRGLVMPDGYVRSGARSPSAARRDVWLEARLFIAASALDYSG